MNNHKSSSNTNALPPLHGIKVIELARVLAGPWAGQTLADLGAEVIKIESPEGDDTRSWGPPFYEYNQDSHSPDHNKDAAYFHSCNHTKTNLIMNFTNQEDVSKLLNLIKDADIVIENFKKDGLKKYGLDYESLSRINPRLIYCSITGFGQDGPYSHFPGYDLLIQGMSGMMSITGEREGEPQKMGLALVDIITGLYSTIAIEAALLERSKSGLGQHIDMALLDCMMGVLSNQAQNYFASGTPPLRRGNAHPNIVPYQLFDVNNGHVLIAVGNDSQFSHLCEVLGIAEIARNPDYKTNQARVQNRESLIPMLQNEFRKWKKSDLLAELHQHNVPAGPVNNIEEAMKDPQVIARALVQDVEAPNLKAKSVQYIRNPIRFSRSPLVPLAISPAKK